MDGVLVLAVGVFGIVEDGEEPEVFFLRDGVVLVVVALAQPIVVPIQTDIVVLTRSTTATLRYSSRSEPPSLLVCVLR